MTLGVYITFAPEDQGYAEQLRDLLIDRGVLIRDAMGGNDRNEAYSCFFPGTLAGRRHVHATTVGCVIVICSAKTEGCAEISEDVALAHQVRVPVYAALASDFYGKDVLLKQLGIESFVQGASFDEQMDTLAGSIVPPAIEYKNCYLNRNYSGRKLVLFVDDVPLYRIMPVTIASLRLKENFYPILAGNGGEALEVLEHVRPDLVVLDIAMPGIDGMEALDRIKKNPKTQSINVIMFTARSGKEETLAIEMGACAYVNKSRMEQLFDEMRKVLG